jgi:hypothetical protein
MFCESWLVLDLTSRFRFLPDGTGLAITLMFDRAVE